jgi:hypothetical protein
MRLLCALCLLLIGALAQAADLTHFAQDGRIGARLRALGYPESLRKDLRSGLTNRLLVKISLQEGGRALETANAQIALQYDLWDERFHVELSVNGVALDGPQLRDVEAALAWLSDLRLPGLFKEPATASTLTLKAQVLLNPIERERMERIREWVQENSSYVPLEGAARGPSPEQGSNALFNRIFEQYVAGEQVAAQWKQEVTSSPFGSVTRP